MEAIDAAQRARISRDDVERYLDQDGFDITLCEYSRDSGRIIIWRLSTLNE
jgi:hypothetical protein